MRAEALAGFADSWVEPANPFEPSPGTHSSVTRRTGNRGARGDGPPPASGPAGGNGVGWPGSAPGRCQGQVTRTMDSALQVTAAVSLAVLVSVGAEAVRWPVTVTGPRVSRPSGTRKVLLTLALLAMAP